MRVLLVTSEATLVAGRNLGSSKDVTYRIDFLRRSGVEVDVMAVPTRNDRNCENSLRKIFLKQYLPNAVIFEHCRWPRSAAFVKKFNPSIVVIFRSHNEEILHSMDMLHCFIVVSKFGKGYFRRLLSLIRRVVSSLVYEVRCFYVADKVLICNETSVGYFSKFPLRASNIVPVNTHYDVNYSPTFFSAYRKQYLADDRLNVLVMGSATPTLFNDHALHTLKIQLKFFERYSSKSNPRFVISGLYSDVLVPRDTDNVRYVGVVDDPLALIAACDGIFLPSPRGRGIKTRIFDAVSVGTPILVHRLIHEGLPPDIKNCVDPWSGDHNDLKSWIESLNKIGRRGPNNLSRYRSRSDRNLLMAIGMADPKI